MTAAHAFLPPSAAHVWVKCAMWPTMNRLYPETGDKPEAREGTGAHWGFEQLLHYRPLSEGMIADNGVVITDEMIQGAEMYAAQVGKAYASVGTVSHYKVEQRVTIPWVHANNWGTPDTWVFGHNPTTGRALLIVLDYKFGHEFVEVVENWQMLDYTCGILDELGIKGNADDMVDVEFHLVQPRSYHRDGPIRVWSGFTARDMRGYFNTLHVAAEAAHMPNPIASPGPGCKHCPGRHSCEALQRAGYSDASLAMASTPLEMSARAAGLELQMLTRAQERLDARISGLKEQVEHELTSGAPNPYWEMEDIAGKLAWKRPVAEVVALGKMCGAVLEKPGVITPTQAGALKMIDPAVLALYTHRPPGGRKMVPFNSLKARKVFGDWK